MFSYLQTFIPSLFPRKKKCLIWTKENYTPPKPLKNKKNKMHVDGQMILPSSSRPHFQLPNFPLPFFAWKTEKPQKTARPTWHGLLTELQMCLYINFSNSNPRSSSSANWHGNFRPALAPTGSKSACNKLRRFEGSGSQKNPGFSQFNFPLLGIWFAKLSTFQIWICVTISSDRSLQMLIH